MSVLRLYRLAAIIGTRRSPDDIDPICEGWGKILGVAPADRDEVAEYARTVVPVAARAGDDDPTAIRAVAALLKFVGSVTDQVLPSDPTVPTRAPYFPGATSAVYRLAVAVGAWHGPSKIQPLCESWGWILGLTPNDIAVIADCARSNSAVGRDDDPGGRYVGRRVSPADMAAELCDVLVGIAKLATAV